MTFMTKEDFDSVRQRNGAYLPHWTMTGAIYHVSFRLHDAIPAQVRKDLLEERQQILARIKDPSLCLTKYEKYRLVNLYSDKIERYLDAGHGACFLRDRVIAELVSNALEYFEGSRYRLFAWCVMPNHVHAMVQPLTGFHLPDILYSWKSYTAHEANKILGRNGKFWQQEYYDRMMRSEESLMNTMEYIFMNPDKAGLGNWSWRWKRDEI